MMVTTTCIYVVGRSGVVCSRGVRWWVGGHQTELSAWQISRVWKRFLGRSPKHPLFYMPPMHGRPSETMMARDAEGGEGGICT